MPTTTPTDLRPAQVAPHPNNPRRDLGDLTELTASIKSVGVLHRLLVAPVPVGFPGKAQYVILAGHRRLAAAKAAKAKTIPVEIREDLTDPADQLAAMLQENGQRIDLTPAEETRAVQGMLDLGLNQKQVATKVHKSPGWVSERARLAKLPTTVADKVHTHQVTLTDALAVGEFAGYPDLEEEVLGALGATNFRWALESARRTLKERKDHEAERKAYVKAGVTILDEAPPEPDADDEGDDTPEWWRLEDILDGYSKVDDAVAAHAGIDVESVEWEHVEKWHQETCGGHAVFEEVTKPYYSGQTTTMWRPICTTPHAHDDLRELAAGDVDEAAPASPRRDEEYARQKAELEQLAQDLGTATAVRRGYTRDVLSGVVDTGRTLEAITSEVLTSDILTRATWWCAEDIQNHQEHSYGQFRATVATWVGLDHTGEPTKADVLEAVKSFLASADLPQLILLGILVRELDNETDISNLDRRMWAWRHARDYLTFLRDALGYGFTEVEERFLPDSLRADDSTAETGDEVPA